MKKVSELTGAELALWVAKANKIETPGHRPLYVAGDCLYVESGYGGESHLLIVQIVVGSTAVILSSERELT